jgi:hypothetical protein
MFEKPVVWQSSMRVFKDAARALSRRSGLVVGLLIGEFVLLALLSWVSGGAIPFTNAGGMMRWLGMAALYLYQLVFMITIVHVVMDTEQKRFSDLLLGQVLPRLPAAIALGLILSVAVLVGTFLLVIPGVILSVYTSMALFILIVERASVGESIRRSIFLVSGWWWRVCSRVIFTMWLAALLALISSVPLTGVIVSLPLSLILAPLITAYMTLTYRELAEKKRLLTAAPVSVGGKMAITLSGVLALTALVGASLLAQMVVGEGINRRLVAPEFLQTQLYLEDDGSVTQDVLRAE